MHTAAASRSRTSPRVETVLTAQASRAQLRDVWAKMEEPDEYSSPGPARVLSVTLSSGHIASLVFHESKNSIEVLALLEPSVEAGLADLLADLTVPPEAITWTHERIDRRAIVARHRLSFSKG